MTLVLKRNHFERIVEHAKAGYPHEACGLISGREGVAERFYPMRNAAASGTVYLLDSKEQLQVMQDIEESEQDIVGIYHSHVASPAFPSATDVEQAFYPEAAYVIVSLADFESPDLKAYRIVEGKISEEPVEVVEG